MNRNHLGRIAGSMAVAAFLWAPLVAQDEVNLVAPKAKAYESNVAGGYGEVQVTRTGSAGSLRVYMTITPITTDPTVIPPQPVFVSTAGTVAFAYYAQDCDIRYVLPPVPVTPPPADASTLPDGTAFPHLAETSRVPFDALALQHYIEFPDGVQTMRLRIYAWRENTDKERPEMAEILRFTLQPRVGNPYAIGANQAQDVTVVDGNVTLAVRVDDGVAEELDPAANPVTGGGTVTGDARLLGNMRMWFENASRRVAGDTTSAAPRAGWWPGDPKETRQVELTKSGDADVPGDGVVWATIGGGLVSDRVLGANDVYIHNPFAYRTVSEYGTPLMWDDVLMHEERGAANGFINLGTTAAGSLDVNISRTGNVQAVIESIAGVDFAAVGAATTSVVFWNGPAPGSTVSMTGLRVDRTNGTDLTLQNRLIASIRDGSDLMLRVMTITPATTSASASATITGVSLQIHNPVLYERGTYALGVSNASSRLYRGDQIVIGGQRYRVIGPNSITSSHPSGWMNNQMAQQLPPLPYEEPNQTGARGPLASGEPPQENGWYWIVIYPALRADLMRPGVGNVGAPAQTLYPLTFPAANGRKEVIDVVPMPVGGDADGIGAPYGHPHNYPNELPNGDWIDIGWITTPDTTVEGAEAFTVTANTTTANNGYDILTPQSGTVVVADNDATVRIVTVQNGIEPVSAAVSGVPALFQVVSSSAFPKDISVPFTILDDGTTTALQSDYTIQEYDAGIQRGSVLLKAGETTATIRVDPVNGAISAPGESMGLQLLPSYDYRLLGQDGGTNNSVATATIYDNQDRGAASLTLDTAATLNGNGREHPTTSIPLRFVVSMPAPVAVATNVSFAITALSTAVAGIDYTAPTLSYVTIPAGASQAVLSIDVLDDLQVEAPETVVVNLVSGANYTLSTQIQATGTIYDDEPTVSIVSTTPSTTEPSTLNGPVTPGRLIVSYPGVPTGSALNRDITVTFNVTGTATNGVDYQTLSGSVIIPANQLSTGIDVTPLYDGLLEGSETVIVTLVDDGGPLAGLFDLGTSSASVVIADDTTALNQARIAAVDGAAAESDGLIKNDGSLLVSLDRWRQLILSGTYVGGETSITLASSTGLPVTLAAGVEIWLPGATVSAADDVRVVVLSSTVVATPSSVALTAALPAGTYLSGTCYAANGLSDQVAVSLLTGGSAVSGVDYVALSSTVSFEVLTLSGGPYAAVGATVPVTVTLSNASGAITTLPAGAELRLPGASTSPADDLIVVVSTATAVGSTSGPVQVVGMVTACNAGQSHVQSRPVLVQVIDDMVVESTETVVASLVSGAHYAVSTTASQGTVTILDDEPTVSVFASVNAQEPSSSSGAGAVNGQLRFSYPGVPAGTPLNRDVTVHYTVNTASTATPNTDYTALVGTVTIPAGSLYVDVPVVPQYDVVSDPNETVVVDVTPSPGPSAYAVSTTQATIRIIDVVVNQGLITTTQTTTPPSESSTAPGTATITVELARVGNEAVTVPYRISGSATSAGTAAYGTRDYIALSGSVVFAETRAAAGLTLVTGTSGAANSTYSIPLRLSTGSTTVPNGGSIYLGTYAGGALVPGSLVRFAVTGGAVTIDTLARSVSLMLPAAATVPAVAIGDLVGVATQEIVVQVLDDLVVEGDEVIDLTFLSGANYSVSPVSGSQTVTIRDDEPTISITTIQNAVEPISSNNAGIATGILRFSYPGVPVGTALGRDITVPYTINSSSTATPGLDYSALSGVATIPANSLYVDVQVWPIYDTLTDPNETVIVDISSPMTPVSYRLGTSKATVIITDAVTSQGIVSTSLIGSPAAEHAVAPGKATITVTLARTGNEAVIVPFAVSGTAVASGTTGGGTRDYMALSGTVVFAETWAASPLALMTGTLGAAGSTYSVSLMTATGAATVPAGGDIYLGTYGGTPRMLVPGTLVRFTMVGTASLTTAAQPVVITLPEASAALPTVVANDLAGIGTQLVEVQVIDDLVAEVDETVVVTLQAGSNYTLNPSSSTQTVTINDNEPRLYISEKAHPTEGGAAGYFRVTTQQVVDHDITFTYVITGTATPGGDYSTLSGTAKILAFQDSVLITVTALADGINDPNETVVLTLQSDLAVPAAYLIVAPYSDNVTIIQDAATQQANASSIQPVAVPVTPSAYMGAGGGGDSGGCGVGSGLGLVVMGAGLALMAFLRRRRIPA